MLVTVQQLTRLPALVQPKKPQQKLHCVLCRVHAQQAAYDAWVGGYWELQQLADVVYARSWRATITHGHLIPSCSPAGLPGYPCCLRCCSLPLIQYPRAVQLPQLDQDEMLAIRQSWFDECGAPPPGNKLALERKAWQVCLIDNASEPQAVGAVMCCIRWR